MEDNPYSSMLETMRGHASKDTPPSIKIAKVAFIDDSNIKIEVDNLIVDKRNIYIPDYLLKDYTREVKTDAMNNVPSKQFVNGSTNIVNDGGNSSDHGHSLTSFTINHTKMHTMDTLKVGDLVSVLATPDKQTYVILSKVVRY